MRRSKSEAVVASCSQRLYLLRYSTPLLVISELRSFDIFQTPLRYPLHSVTVFPYTLQTLIDFPEHALQRMDFLLQLKG